MTIIIIRNVDCETLKIEGLNSVWYFITFNIQCLIVWCIHKLAKKLALYQFVYLVNWITFKESRRTGSNPFKATQSNNIFNKFNTNCVTSSSELTDSYIKFFINNLLSLKIARQNDACTRLKRSRQLCKISLVACLLNWC